VVEMIRKKGEIAMLGVVLGVVILGLLVNQARAVDFGYEYRFIGNKKLQGQGPMYGYNQIYEINLKNYQMNVVQIGIVRIRIGNFEAEHSLEGVGKSWDAVNETYSYQDKGNSNGPAIGWDFNFEDMFGKDWLFGYRIGILTAASGAEFTGISKDIFSETQTYSYPYTYRSWLIVLDYSAAFLVGKKLGRFMVYGGPVYSGLTTFDIMGMISHANLASLFSVGSFGITSGVKANILDDKEVKFENQIFFGEQNSQFYKLAFSFKF